MSCHHKPVPSGLSGQLIVIQPLFKAPYIITDNLSANRAVKSRNRNKTGFIDKRYFLSHYNSDFEIDFSSSDLQSD